MTKIIVVDDEPNHLELVATILERAGYSVITADNGGDCLQRLGLGEVDLIITDIFMPKVDGLQLASEMNSREHRIPMIAMTGGMRGHFEPFSEIIKRMGAKSILTKPFSAEQLLDAVRQSLT